MIETHAGAIERGRALLAAAGLAASELEARVLCEHAAGLDRASLLARGSEPIDPAAAARYDHLLGRRSSRVPLAYVTGEREFWSLRLLVDHRVLVPRPETETLVEATLERLGPAARVADVGTGSGAIVIALARELGSGRFLATDRSAAALTVARENAAAHGLAQRITFLEGDLLAPLAGCQDRLDAIVSNPPYISEQAFNTLPPNVRDHEPRLALVIEGSDGLEMYRRFAVEAPAVLAPGGRLLVEVGHDQPGAVRAIFAADGRWRYVGSHRDPSDPYDRVLEFTR